MIRKIREAQEREEGFTLIELLVVVIIIGILAAIAIPTFLNQRDNAKISAARSDARNAAIEVESYYTTNLDYPASLPASVTESQGVDLTYTPDASGDAFCIAADHTDVDGSGTFEAYYDSDAGGVLPAGQTC